MAPRRQRNIGPVAPVEPSILRSTCDPSSLGFKSTDELEHIDTPVGQGRALAALRFGTGMNRPGYNLFALGPQGTGRHRAIMSVLSEKAASEPAPDDWVYVHDFTADHVPKALRLPAGTAIRFCEAMEELVDDLRGAIPAMFQSDEYREKRRAIDAEIEEMQSKAFESLRAKAEAQDVGIVRTPMGFALAPMHAGQVIKPEAFNALPDEERAAIEAKIAGLQEELAGFVEQMPHLEKTRRDKVRTLNSELTRMVVEASIKVFSDRFSDIRVIQDRLAEVQDDLAGNAELFLPHAEADNRPAAIGSEAAADRRFNRYRVNVMVSNGHDSGPSGAPLVTEDHPTLGHLVGRVEHVSQFGALITDFSMIRPGALHRANGGYLVLDVRKILAEPFAWEALKRTLRSGQITIVSAAQQLSLASTTAIEPEPIPLKVKVVLIGERLLYYLLCAHDPDFPDLFKVQVDFEEELPRTTDNSTLYARLVASITKRENLRPFNAGAVARVIDEAARLADDAERLSLKVDRLADLLQEADFWAGDAGRRTVRAGDVERAVNEQIRRADRIRQKSHEAIERGTILIDTDGDAVGQVNGLSVIGVGNFAFGRPSRITARVRTGAGKVIDIERETKLGGPLHSKGVLILSGYLAATYALDAPASLWASIVFEQSYGGVDGDSASSAELYALLSALADVPIRQSMAVTGSVNQHGEVQAIGGVNEKIEGFFDVCSAQGLSRGQGVLIPAANTKHLMLRPDIVAAAKKGRFDVYPVSTIAEGIELLTGKPAGERQNDGEFPAGSINALVEDKLRRFAGVRRSFSAGTEVGPRDVESRGEES